MGKTIKKMAFIALALVLVFCGSLQAGSKACDDGRISVSGTAAGITTTASDIVEALLVFDR